MTQAPPLDPAVSAGESGTRRIEPRRPRRSHGDRAFAGVAHIVLVVWTLAVVLPLLWTVYSSFKTSREILTSPFSMPSEWSLDNFITAWTEAGIGRYFVNTLIVVGGETGPLARRG